MSEIESSFKNYGAAFQEQIVQGFLSDPRWSDQMLEVVKTEYFDLKYLQFLVDRYFAYARKYKNYPTLTLLVTIISDELKTGTDKVLKDQIIDFLKRIRSNPNPGDLPYVKERALDFCRRQALKSALESSIDLIGTEKYEAIVDVIKRAVMVGTSDSSGHDFFEDVEARFVKISRSPITTGLEELDSKDIMNGGLGGGELGVVMAPTGIGKCIDKKSTICIKIVGIKINGKVYKPWDRIATKRGVIFARDVVESDELV